MVQPSSQTASSGSSPAVAHLLISSGSGAAAAVAHRVVDNRLSS